MAFDRWRVVNRFFLLSVLSVQLLVAQHQHTMRGYGGTEVHLTGNLRADLFWLTDKGEAKRDDAEDQAKVKSPLRAALFSAVLPGVGEFYVGDQWRAAAFLATETAFWIVYAVYDSKGDRQARLFEQFADDHWSVVRYVEWIDRYKSQLNAEAQGSAAEVIIPGTENLPSWQRVYWNKLNAWEEQIGKKTGNGFTHRLPQRPEQQYYELIGKYPQYAGGWNDGTNITPGDITSGNVSQNFLDYAAMRGKANDFYNIATTFSYLLVANHLISALDAALLASHHNKHLSLKAHLQPTPRQYGMIEFVPTARLRLEF